MFFRSEAEQAFNVDTIESPVMDTVIKKCAAVYSGEPPWKDVKNGIRTINFAKSLSSETARLATLAIKITIEGSARAEWLQQQTDAVFFSIRKWVEYGCAYGTVVIKPNGKTLDVFTPDEVLITDYDNQNITGMIFKDTYTQGKWYYTRLEYHRFAEEKQGEETVRPYYISNRAYRSKSPDSIGDPVALKDTKWSELMADSPPILKTNGESLDGPMFGVFVTPQANNVDKSTPLGLPVYAEALEELKDLDIAYSRMTGEINDSERIVLADDRLLSPAGTPVNKMTPGAAATTHLPKYVRNVYGDGTDTFYQEINPTLNTEVRVNGLNALLSQIGYKAGFSNGYFVFDQKTGMVTATQVESDDRRTIQYIKDVRDQLEKCMDAVYYALSVYADLYGESPAGEYEVTYDFGDITYNREEDRARWWGYVTAGKVPAWMYFVKFEGFSEEDAKAMVEEATPKEEELFDSKYKEE
jgi:A118 family predicted phage portal protein